MQVIEAFRLFSLKTLWATYHKVDIMTITCMTPGFVRGSVLETAEYIQGLIDTGKLKATLLKPSEDARSWELSNDEGLEDFPEALRLAQVVEQTQNMKDLAKHVRENDRKMSLSKEFVDWTKKTNKSKEMAENSEFTPFVPSEYTADEDMMADV